MNSMNLKDKIIVRNEKEIRIIYLESLLAIRVNDYLCTFFIENNLNFSCTKSLNEVESLLPKYFIRINRNIVINEHKIQSVDFKNKTIKLISGESYAYSIRKNNLIKERLRAI